MLANIIFGIPAMTAWPFMMLLWPMAFDAPGSEKHWENWLFVSSLFLYGPAYLASLICGWQALAKNRFAEAATVGVVFPSIPVLLGIGVSVFHQNPTILAAALIILAGVVAGYVERTKAA